MVARENPEEPGNRPRKRSSFEQVEGGLWTVVADDFRDRVQLNSRRQTVAEAAQLSPFWISNGSPLVYRILSTHPRARIQDVHIGPAFGAFKQMKYS